MERKHIILLAIFTDHLTLLHPMVLAHLVYLDYVMAFCLQRLILIYAAKFVISGASKYIVVSAQMNYLVIFYIVDDSTLGHVCNAH